MSRRSKHGLPTSGGPKNYLGNYSSFFIQRVTHCATVTSGKIVSTPSKLSRNRERGGAGIRASKRFISHIKVPLQQQMGKFKSHRPRNIQGPHETMMVSLNLFLSSGGSRRCLPKRIDWQPNNATSWMYHHLSMNNPSVPGYATLETLKKNRQNIRHS